jgi:simple sugar transport system permease protein
MAARAEASRAFSWRPWAVETALYAGALLAAVVVTGLLIALLGADPFAAYETILRSSLGSLGGIAQTLNKATPLLLGSLAATFAMRGSFLNIGIDGQIYFGAIFATGLGLLLGSSAPAPFGALLVLPAGALGGALLALPAALLRAYAGVSEIFVTVMLNFVATSLVEYLTTGPWNEPMAGEAISKQIPLGTTLPLLLPQAGAHAGIVIALLVAVGLGWVLGRTLLGYHIRAAGDNQLAARIGGVDLRHTALAALCASGAVAGLAGAIEVAGFHHRLILGLSPGYGYMAILLAVLGKRSVPGVTIAALAFAVLLVGSDSLQRSVRLPASTALVFQAVIVLVVLFAESVRGWRAWGRRRRASISRPPPSSALRPTP